MPFPTSARLPFSKPSLPLRLEHELFPLPNNQRRLACRSGLRPIIDLDAYRFCAVTDWIQFRIHFARKTQVQHVQAVLRKFLDHNCLIEPEDEGPGGVFSCCRITVQEPSSLALIARIHRSLASTFGAATGARVTALELSSDAYPIKAAEDARKALLGALQRTIWTGRDIWTRPNSRPRMVWGKERNQRTKLSPKPEEDGTMQCSSIPDRHRAVFVDATMYLGAQDDDVMIRVMDKLLDRQRPGGSSMVLSEKGKRVRIEVTVRGDELAQLGITDIDSLRRIRFPHFQKRYFQAKLPTFPTEVIGIHRTLEEWRAEIYLKSGVTGLIAGDRAKKRSRTRMWPAVRDNLRVMDPGRKFTREEPRLEPPFVSWDAMNRKINVALQQLAKREATAWMNLLMEEEKALLRTGKEEGQEDQGI